MDTNSTNATEAAITPECEQSRLAALRPIQSCWETRNLTLQSTRFGRRTACAYSPSKVIPKWRGEVLRCSPQPLGNNFGGGPKLCCEQAPLLLNPRVEHAGSGRRIPRSNATTFTRRLSLRHPAPGRKGTLRTFRLQVQTWQRRTSISDSIRPGPRARQN